MRFCPACGHASLRFDNNHVFRCNHCDFELYFNVAAAVGAVIRHGDALLLSVRAHDPASGKLDFPGGFVDPGESLEEALLRELQEELHFTPTQWHYLVSFPNTYPYHGQTYTTADAFFVIDVPSRDGFIANDEISALHWIELAQLRPEDMAFVSGARLVALLQQSA